MIPELCCETSSACSLSRALKTTMSFSVYSFFSVIQCLLLVAGVKRGFFCVYNTVSSEDFCVVEIFKMPPKTSRTGRHSKRTGSSPEVPAEGNHYHTLRQEEKTSPRERSTSKRRRTEESNQQSKITDFTGGGQGSEKTGQRTGRRGDREK